MCGLPPLLPEPEEDYHTMFQCLSACCFDVTVLNFNVLVRSHCSNLHLPLY